MFFGSGQQLLVDLMNCAFAGYFMLAAGQPLLSNHSQSIGRPKCK
jgi:hypothetical protein